MSSVSPRPSPDAELSYLLPLMEYDRKIVGPTAGPDFCPKLSGYFAGMVFRQHSVMGRRYNRSSAS